MSLTVPDDNNPIIEAVLHSWDFTAFLATTVVTHSNAHLGPSPPVIFLGVQNCLSRWQSY